MAFKIFFNFHLSWIIKVEYSNFPALYLFLQNLKVMIEESSDSSVYLSKFRLEICNLKHIYHFQAIHFIQLYYLNFWCLVLSN